MTLTIEWGRGGVMGPRAEIKKDGECIGYFYAEADDAGDDLEAMVKAYNEYPPFIPWGPDSPGYPACPVPAGSNCEMLFRIGAKTSGRDPENCRWAHAGDGSDIVAYRRLP